MRLAVAENPGDGEGHLGCAACPVFPATCPPGEHVIGYREVVKGPYAQILCDGPDGQEGA